MKTQINTLLKGDHREHIIGTNYNERMRIANKVIEENPKEITLNLRGYTINLKANWSISRKTVSYFGTIPIKLYKSFCGNFALPKKSPETFMQIQGNMEVWLSTNSKKSCYQIIQNKEITITNEA